MDESFKLSFSIEELLQKDGLYVGPTVGVSMLPILRERRDTIVVRPKRERLKPLDVALYRRGGRYVLHRVIALTDDGYVIRGDNCYSDEYIPEEDVFGVLTEYFRDNRHHLCTDGHYIRYSKRRVKNYKFRRFFVLLGAKIRAGFRKIFKKKGK